VCETSTGNHVCTLRGAIEEANAHAGADTITLQANVTYVLSLTATLDNATADLLISDSVTIAGAGRNRTIIDGNGAATGQRVFFLFRCVGDIYDPQTQSCPNGNVSVNMSGVAIKNGISGNLAGGIYNGATLNLTDVAVTDNTASGLNDWGGGIYNAGPLTMTNCLLANNKTGAHNAYGGGMYSQGALTIGNSTISGNSTFAGASSPGEGGGLFLVGAAVTIFNSTISGNSAAIGGGIYKAGYPLTLINDTISGNFSNGYGGGLYNASGTTGLYNATVTENQANADDSGFDVGGGIANAAGATLTTINSIIADNQVVIPTLPYPTLDLDECSGTITSQGYNIFVYVNAGNCTVNGSYSTSDPLLGSLQFNGGPTQTSAIAPGSPAIDAGNPAGCTDNLGAPVTTDQRGVPRPYGAHCDIGAFEYADIIFRNGFEPGS